MTTLINNIATKSEIAFVISEIKRTDSSAKSVDCYDSDNTCLRFAEWVSGSPEGYEVGYNTIRSRAEFLEYLAELVVMPTEEKDAPRWMSHYTEYSDSYRH